jgi:hypothetical protein
MDENIEFIVTVRCKLCGHIASLEIPLTFEKAQKAIQEFTKEHRHSVDPWAS